MNDGEKEVLGYLIESHKASEEQQAKLLQNQSNQLNKTINYLLVVSFMFEGTDKAMLIYRQLQQFQDVKQEILQGRPNGNRPPSGKDPRDTSK